MYQTQYHQSSIADKRFLVTGGAGFIGSNIVEYLLKYGAKAVRVVDNLLTGSAHNLATFQGATNFEFIQGDIRDLEICKAVCRGMDIVCHQAALGSVSRSVQEPYVTTQHNVDGFVNMVFAAHQQGIKRFVYASSSSVYGDERQLPKVEDKIGKPLSPYAITKLSNELFAANFGQLYEMELIGFRYFNVFGFRQSPKGAYAAVIPLFIDACLNGKVAYINGDGLQTRDFTFVENVVQINIKAMLSRSSEAYNQVYNVGCGGNYSVIALFEAICKALGIDKKPVFREARAGDIRDSRADISKAKTLLGYDPLFSFQQGLAITLEHFKQKIS